MYKIVIDSCGELPEDLKKDGHYQNVSLELEEGFSSQGKGKRYRTKVGMPVSG